MGALKALPVKPSRAEHATRLAELWETNCPDLRFAQLLASILGDGVDRFYVEDDDMLRLFQSHFSKSRQNTGKSFDEVLEEKLKDPEFKAEWDALEHEFHFVHSSLEHTDSPSVRK